MGSRTQRSVSRTERLVEAARSGDWQQTIALLRNIPQQFSLGKNGEFALQEMVRHGHLAVIDILIDRGVSAIATDKQGFAPLHIAAQNRHEHVVRHLVNTVPRVKENINQVCGEGFTAYQLARQSGYDTTCTLLVDLGAEARDDSAPQTPTNPSPPSAEPSDYVLRISARENAMDESMIQLQKQIRDMTFIIQQSFQEMKKVISTILGKQAKDTTRQLAELKQKMQQCEDNIVDETVAINDGMDTLRMRTDELRTTFHQAGEYNEIVYFHVFHMIAKTVGMKRNTWKELCTSLLADYPKELVEKIVKEVKDTHTSEEDMAYEVLTKWKVYNQYTPDKVGSLKTAIKRTSSKIDSLVADIDSVINQHNKITVKKPKEVISDRLLLDIASGMHETDYVTIGTRLGISMPRLDQLRHDHLRDSRTRNVMMMTSWRDAQDGSKVTIQSRFIEALNAAGRRDLAEKVTSSKT